MSTLPPNWPAGALRKYLIGSLIAGSTELVDVGDAAHATAAAQHAAGVLAGQAAKDRGQRKRSAIRQVIGLEPVKAGPDAGGLMQLIPLDDEKFCIRAKRRLRDNPQRFGITMEEVPSDSLVREVRAEEREKKLASE